MSRTPRETSVRNEKMSVASLRAPLKYKGLDTENFFHRWFLDYEDRIAAFQEMGYDLVKPTKQGTSVGESTVNSSSGLDSRVTKSAGFGGLRLVLMRIPIDRHKEIQAEKAREVDEIEESIRTQVKNKVGVDYGKTEISFGKASQ